MKSVRTKEITRQVAKEFGISMGQVDDIISTPFQFQVNSMKSVFDIENEHYPTLGVPNFGKFFVPQHKRKK